MKFLTDEQFDELMDHMQGLDISEKDAMESLSFKGFKLTKDQTIFKKENYKRCRRYKSWNSVDEICSCR